MRKHSVPLAQVLNLLLLLTLLIEVTVQAVYKLFYVLIKCAICELSLNGHFL